MAAPWLPPLYPRMHLLPNGTLFYSGSTPSSWIFNPSNNSWSSANATTNYGGIWTYGSSVLFSLSPSHRHKPTLMVFFGGPTPNPPPTPPKTNTPSPRQPPHVSDPPM